MFDDAKKKEKILKLPESYDVVRKGKIVKIKSKHISDVWINEQQYTLSLFDHDNIIVFKDIIDFQLFIFDHFYKLTKVYVDRETVGYCYYLYDGVLHNTCCEAYEKCDRSGNVIESEFYLNGREVDETKVKQIVREKKLDRISQKDEDFFNI